jgi:hypothetical protein
MEKHQPSLKERSLLTVRMCEERLPSTWRWIPVVAIGSATSSSPPRSLGTTLPLMRERLRWCNKSMICNARTPPQHLQDGTWCL